jgi:anti-sigma regulatory factor (Ser/Thr protein kinase)
MKGQIRKSFAVTVGIDLAEIDRVNAAFAEFAEVHDLPAKIRRSVRVVFDELLNNAISYGFEGRDSGEITVDVELAGDRLSVTITDDGKPFNPFREEPPDTLLSTQERRIGGLGIHLVRQAMDEVSYHRRTDRNVVMLAKRVTDD